MSSECNDNNNKYERRKQQNRQAQQTHRQKKADQLSKLTCQVVEAERRADELQSLVSELAEAIDRHDMSKVIQVLEVSRSNQTLSSSTSLVPPLDFDAPLYSQQSQLSNEHDSIALNPFLQSDTIGSSGVAPSPLRHRPPIFPPDLATETLDIPENLRNDSLFTGESETEDIQNTPIPLLVSSPPTPATPYSDTLVQESSNALCLINDSPDTLLRDIDVAASWDGECASPSPISPLVDGFIESAEQFRDIPAQSLFSTTSNPQFTIDSSELSYPSRLPSQALGLGNSSAHMLQPLIQQNGESPQIQQFESHIPQCMIPQPYNHTALVPVGARNLGGFGMSDSTRTNNHGMQSMLFDTPFNHGIIQQPLTCRSLPFPNWASIPSRHVGLPGMHYHVYANPQCSTQEPVQYQNFSSIPPSSLYNESFLAPGY